MSNEIIGLPEFVFWGLMFWICALALIILLMLARPMIAAWLRSRRVAEMEKAPKGQFSHLREQVERADRAARGI